MLPDSPKTSESEMTLPTLTPPHNHTPLLSPRTTTSPTLIHNDLFENTNQMHINKIMPGIYFSNTVDFWKPEHLRSHGFTHIINIDKHIQQQAFEISKYYCNAVKTNMQITTSTAPSSLSPALQLINSKQPYLHDLEHEKYAAFEFLDLNFGEASYLMTVLPNCYKAVKFIDKALQNGGAILVIDPISDQKCLTIVIGYLMYKNNINFNDAFQRVKKVFKTAELERFFISQLYEYEPILQVERAQSRGHSCSRELRSAQLKRKKLHDDSNVHHHHHLQNDFNFHQHHHFIVTTTSSHHNFHIDNNYNYDVIME